MRTKSNSVKSKTILAFRNAGEKEVKVITAVDEDTKSIREGLKDFLLKNLGITDFKEHLICGEHNGTVQSYLVKTLDDDEFYRVYSGMNRQSKRENAGKMELNDLNESNFISFIYSLILEGSLKFPMGELTSKEEELSEIPMIFLCKLLLNTDNEEGDDNYYISSFATNDNLLINVDGYNRSEDQHKQHSYSDSINADSAIQRMIKHNMIDCDQRYGERPTANQSAKTIRFKFKEGSSHIALINNTDEASVIENSLLLSDAFLEVFVKESSRDFLFDQRVMTSINASVITRWGFLPKEMRSNKLLHNVIHSIDTQEVSKALLGIIESKQAGSDKDLSKLLVGGLNDFFFNRAYSGFFVDKNDLISTDGSKVIPIDTDKKENANYAYGSVNLGRIMACIVDKNKAGELLEMTLCQSNSKKLIGIDGDSGAYRAVKKTYSLTISRSINGGLEINRIHKSKKLGVLVNKIAEIIKSRNSDGKGYLETHEFMPLLQDCFDIHGNKELLKADIGEL